MQLLPLVLGFNLWTSTSSSQLLVSSAAILPVITNISSSPTYQNSPMSDLVSAAGYDLTTDSDKTQASSNLTPDGRCGGSDGYTCLGNPSGEECCGLTGYCGSGPQYCAASCQPSFGVCLGGNSTSDSAVTTTTNIPSVLQTLARSSPGIVSSTVSPPSNWTYSASTDKEPCVTATVTLNETSANTTTISWVASNMTKLYTGVAVAGSSTNEAIGLAAGIFIVIGAVFWQQ